MSETKWTPGPWQTRRAGFAEDSAFNYGIVADIGGKSFVIAEAFGRVSIDIFPDVTANANLIAAAPDLYEALNTFVEEYVSMVASGDCGTWNPEDEAFVKAARAALAKARGES